MTPPNEPTIVPSLNCWNEIGISGDRSCPELSEVIHCRNCPVFARAAQSFFDRAAPKGYLEEWSAQIAGAQVSSEVESVSLLIFRLGGEWFGLRTELIVEVTGPRPTHSIPHRKSAILEGMVNLRGQLQLQISLKTLFGVADAPRLEKRDVAENPFGLGVPRLVVLKRNGVIWVFLADEVRDVRRFPKSDAQVVPSTLSNPSSSYSQAVFLEERRTIGYLDDRRLFDALRDLQG